MLLGCLEVWTKGCDSLSTLTGVAKCKETRGFWQGLPTGREKQWFLLQAVAIGLGLPALLQEHGDACGSSSIQNKTVFEPQAATEAPVATHNVLHFSFFDQGAAGMISVQTSLILPVVPERTCNERSVHVGCK